MNYRSPYIVLCFLWWLFLLLPGKMSAQLSAEGVQSFLQTNKSLSSELIFLKEVKEFYTQRNYAPAWQGTEGKQKIAVLTDRIENSEAYGLDKKDYQPQLLGVTSQKTIKQQNGQDSLLAELKYTDAAIHFVHDVLAGNKPVMLGYNGLNYSPSCYDVPGLLNKYFNENKFSLFPEGIESQDSFYISVKEKLNVFRRVIETRDFKDEIVSSAKVNTANKQLVSRLSQLGFISTSAAEVNETILKNALKKAQEMFDLMSDGVLRKTAMEAINVPLAARVNELKFTLNTLRWISCVKQSENNIVLINIPTARLDLYQNGKIVFETKIIVGKSSTPTPTLSSRITEVVLYPYWIVPYKIATKELLPIIKRSLAYLDANNFQVMNSKGKVIDPSKINWRSLGPGNFPYTLRQSTGCDNSLGLIKLNFYNPFTVYLHDTPWKSLFNFNKRYFSHGCMRVEDAMELGHYILKGNTIAIDTLQEKGCLESQGPVSVPATVITPVFVLYNTVWTDASGILRFYEDVYEKFDREK